MSSRRTERLRILLLAIAVVATSVCGRTDDTVSSRQSAVVEVRSPAGPGQLTLPNGVASIKFAVIGDSGRGTSEQREVATQMLRFREQFEFTFVLMLGDNIYEGPATPDDYRHKFEEPYRELLESNVRFFAVLGNHDDPRQVFYPPFNMNGERYYSFGPPGDLIARVAAPVEFFAIDSTRLDPAQVLWLDRRLAESRAEWKIVLLHHPLYTSGRYRQTSRVHRFALEHVLRRNGVDVVFSGHEHIYQRSRLQDGIQYFVSGGAGSLRPGDGSDAPFIARSYSGDYHFMLVEIERRALHFQVIARSGETIDAGTLFPDGEQAGRAGATVTEEDTVRPR